MEKAIVKRATREEILRVSMSLFASRGYEGVSMREIALQVGIQAAALYYHFPDKQRLHLAVMTYAFTDKVSGSIAVLNSDKPPLTRLQRFVTTLIGELTADPELILLLQRERLEEDEERLRLLVEEVFAEPFAVLTKTVKEIAPEQDPFLLAVSIVGLVMFHLESRALHRFIPGWRAEHEWPETLELHVCGLLINLFAREQAIWS